MAYQWNSSSHPISDIRDWENNNRLEIRPDYQRMAVWSNAARIMLIDTILKNIPMPKIFIQAVIRDKDTYRIIIDGQQRITAILDFLKGQFKLESPYEGEYTNCFFYDLPEHIQKNVFAYKVDINEIIDAPDEEIREIYSRVNKYTFALTKQELRKADFPGNFLALSEKLALYDYFEDSKIFTAANRKRMGDVEYISELLAMLLGGPQDKKDTLDDFYQKYSKWEEGEQQQIEEKFQNILKDLLLIFPQDAFPISKTRFKQKADFYSLCAAIFNLHDENYDLEGKSLDLLQQDLKLLDEGIAPESDIKLFSEYAIKCTSQANTIGSRKWRRDFLKDILQGTYIGKPPSDEAIRNFHSILLDLSYTGSDMCSPVSHTCPLCDTDMQDYREKVKTLWSSDSTEFQLSNALFVHIDCLIKKGIENNKTLDLQS